MSNPHEAAAASCTKINRPNSDMDDGRSQFSTQFFAAVRQRDAKRVRDMAKQAGTEQWAEAVRPLCDLLLPPSRRWRTPRNRKRGWTEARAAAVWALGQIGHPMAHRTLARTLACDRDFVVREAALAAVRRFGSAMTPSLVDVVREQSEWELDGMRAVLSSLPEPADLSDPHRRTAGMVLTDVLYENFPNPPRRWTLPARKFGQTTALVLTIIFTIALVREGWFLLNALALAWIPAQLAGFIVKIFTSIPCSTVQSHGERKYLYEAAAEAIERLNDKRAIPGMLQLAFVAPRRVTGRHARSVLLSLLPQIDQHDVALFSSADLEALNGAVAQSLDPALTLAILHALEAVGNGASIRRVQRVSRKSRSAEVRASAARVLEVLEAREARLKISQSLLRGAHAPTAEPDEMLRAAMPQRDEQTEQLLRAVQGE